MKARAMTLTLFLLSRIHPHPSTMMEKSKRARNIQKEVRMHLERQPSPLMGRSSRSLLLPARQRRILPHQSAFPLGFVLLGRFIFRTHPSGITLRLRGGQFGTGGFTCLWVLQRPASKAPDLTMKTSICLRRRISTSSRMLNGPN
jgi:hypothetical protein